ncbi:MFS general substrate transporter [Martensiomyces pterosporus]|nr:MFS general substrate transporter [Martensiomyces pterosporus]
MLLGDKECCRHQEPVSSAPTAAPSIHKEEVEATKRVNNSNLSRAASTSTISGAAGDLEKQTNSAPKSPSPTDIVIEYAKPDSKFGWLVVFCAACNLAVTMGIVNSFGVYQTYYMNILYKNESASELAWVNTLTPFLMLFGAAATGPLTDRFGFRSVALCGVAICCTALMLASLTHAVWQLVLTQSIMFGAGAALLYSPSIALATQWHQRHRALATGLAVAGCGIGGVVFSQITQVMVDSIGYRWSLRTQRFITLTVGGAASAFYRRRISAPRQSITSQFSMLKDVRFAIICMSSLFINLAYFVDFTYLPTAAYKVDGRTRTSANVVLVMNIGNTVGRVLSALVAGKVGAMNTTIACYVAVAVCELVLMLAAKSIGGYYALAIIYGGLCASFTSILPLVLASIFGAQSIASSVGLMNMASGIGVLVGNPVQGALYQAYDRPHGGFTVVTVWCLLAWR